MAFMTASSMTLRNWTQPTSIFTNQLKLSPRLRKKTSKRSMMSSARRQTLILDTFEIKKDSKQLRRLRKRQLKSEQKPAKNRNLSRMIGYLPTGRKQYTSTILLQRTLQLLGFLIPGLNLVGSYLSQPNQLGQTNHPTLLSSWSLHRKVTWKLRSQPNQLDQIHHPILPSSRSLHRNTWKLKLNTYRPHPRKIRIIAPSHMDRPYLLKEKEKLTIITMMMKSNTQDSELSSLASINYQIDDDQ